MVNAIVLTWEVRLDYADCWRQSHRKLSALPWKSRPFKGRVTIENRVPIENKQNKLRSAVAGGQSPQAPLKNLHGTVPQGKSA
jgi:hypothetical protein